MKKYFKWFLVSTLAVNAMNNNLIKAQSNAPLSEQDFLLTIQNIVQTAPNTFQFDIYILDTDPSQPLQLATTQHGINFNPVILNGGAVGLYMTTIVAGSSQLPATMAPIAVSTVSPGLIRVAGRAAPGAGNGFIVSTIAPGTRITTLQMTNSGPFTGNSTPDLSFTSSNATNPSYPTRIAIYVETTNTQIPVTPGINANVLENPALNQPVISNSVFGYLSASYLEVATPPTSYQLTGANLTTELVIGIETMTANPPESQLLISLDPLEGYSNQLIISPENGIVDTTIYVKTNWLDTPVFNSGVITHSSSCAITDTLIVNIENEYRYQPAPIVDIGDVEALSGYTVHIPFTALSDFNVCYAMYYIDFNPTVLSFVGVVNAYSSIPSICNNCLDYECPPYYFSCQINSMATIIDSTHGNLQIRIYYSESANYGGIVVPGGEKMFDLEFLYLGGYSDLSFNNGQYNYACNGAPWDPEIINEPFEDYYFNGSVSPLPPITTNLELNLEGLYNSAIGEMRQARGRVFPAEVADEITVSIAQSTFPYSFEFEVDSVELTRNGHCSVEVPGNLNGEYYIVISHRNSIQTWSKYPVLFNQDTINYVFSDNIQKAYNNNLKLVTDKYCIYAGDINQDGFVDSGDMTILDNESNQFVMGYNPSDINGDVFTDSGDIVMADNNIYTFTSAYQPGSGVPEVSTAIIHNITATSAVSGGEVIVQGTSPVLVRGICWNTAPNPTTANSTSENGSGAGEFTSTMTNLQPNTTYYVRAFATNSETTAYGYQLSFKTEIAIPFLTTTEISELTGSSAVSGGTIISDGGAPITQRGVCWSTSPEPEITDNITNDGTGSGVFVSNLSGLNPNTTYYLRAYAINSAGTGYGNELEFTTPANLPELTTEIATNITSNSATSGGTITNDGGAIITARGVCYSQNPNPTIANDTTLNGVGSGNFISQLTGLLPNVMYYVRAYATNLAGTAYGNEVSFTTDAELASLTTEPISNITGTTATSGGIVTGNGGATITQRGICWSTASNPTLSNHFTSNGSGMGTFVSNLAGLTANTTYYVRAYAINSAGTAYGNEVSFTTALFITGNGVADIEGNTYSSIILGTQEWMGENLKVALYNNGDSIQQVFTSTVWFGLSTGAWCWMNNDNQLENPYGKLYNYYAVTDSRNVCPAGWRMPNDAEWTILTNYLGGTTVAGGKMKSTGTTFWNSPNTGATNASNFSGLPGGYRTDNGTFGNLGSNGIWWSSTELNTSISWYRSLLYNSGSSVRSNNLKKYGFSVRCMRDVGLPTVSTVSITNLTSSTATCGGTISGDGGLPVFQSGICWSNNPNPTLSNNYTNDAAGTGSFVSNIVGLNPATTYFVRAYASNLVGTAYGNEVIFTTGSCGLPITVTHLAGSVAPVDKTISYGTVQTELSGSTKCWITQNLGSDHQANSAYDASEESAGWYWQFNRKQGYMHDGITRTPNTSWSFYEDQTEWELSNDPCNLLLGGWRLPTGTEWQNASLSNEWLNLEDAYNSILALHAAGSLSNWNASLSGRGSIGEYWSKSYCGYEYSVYIEIGSYLNCHYGSSGYPLRCIKDEAPALSNLPVVITSSAIDITHNSALCGGEVTYDGSINVSSRGICWSTNPNPTLSDMFTIEGNGAGYFVSNLTGLTPLTTYFIRSYATNSIGTAYGNQVCITSEDDSFVCGQSFIKNHSAGDFAPINKTVTYGTFETNLSGSSKCWITQNLGADHQAVSGTDETEESAGWYWQFNRKQGYKQDSTNCIPEFNWTENWKCTDWQSENDPCAVLLWDGWRLPTKTEWQTAFNNGGWNISDPFESVLKLHAAGGLNLDGLLYWRGISGYYWSSNNTSSTQPDDGWGFNFYYIGEYQSGNIDYYTKSLGNSVRCIKD